MDDQSHELRVAGQPVPLPAKAFAVLSFLVSKQQRMVSKRELLDKFWPANSTEAALLKTISLIRKSLTQAGADEAIKTYHGQGYRFVGQLADAADPQGSSEDDTEAADAVDKVSVQEQRLVSVLAVALITDAHVEADDPEAIASFEAALQVAKKVIERHQGELLRITVEGFSAAFSQSDLYEDVARRAVLCAGEIEDALAITKITTINKVSAGIATGDTALVPSQSDNLWLAPNAVERKALALAKVPADQSPIQSSIQLRSQSPSQSPGHSIAICDKTLGLLRAEVESQALGVGHLLMSLPKQRAGIPGRPQSTPSKFVGRTAELAFLHAHQQSLASGQGQAVLLSGPAGIGKTRLISELIASQNSHGCQVILVNCLPGLSNSPLAPIQQLCQSLFERCPLHKKLSAIENTLLQELLNQSSAPLPELAELSEHERRQNSYRVLKLLLTNATQHQPLLVIVEDGHWIDATSQEYLNDIFGYIQTLGLMLVVTTRPTNAPNLPETVLKLSPLNSNDCLAILASNSSGQSFSASTANVLVQRAAGNPFFLEELAFATQSGADPNAPPPETVQAVITVRIGALAEELRSLLYIIAVVGPPAPLVLVAHLFGKPLEAIIPALRQLIADGFIVEDADCLSFRHMLITDTAYAMITEQNRASLHGRAATFLEAEDSPIKARPETLARHHQAAGQFEQALHYWQIAARASVSRATHIETLTFTQQGLALGLTETDPQKKIALDLCLMQANAATVLKGFGSQAAGKAYRQADALNNSVGTIKTRIRILVGLWIHTWVLGELDEALNYAEQFMAIAEQAQQPALFLQGHAGMGQVLMHYGKIEQALHHLEQGLAHIKDQPPATVPEQNAAVSCAAYAAWCAEFLGQSTRAQNYYLQSQDLSELIKNPYAQAISYSLCSEHFMVAQNVDACLNLSKKGIEISQGHNFSFWLGTSLVLHGWALGQKGQMAAAFDHINEGITVFEATGAGVQLANWYGLKAQTELAAGLLPEAHASATTALTHAEKTQDVYFTPYIHQVLAKVYSQQSQPELAAQHQQLANKLAADFGYVLAQFTVN